MEKASSDPASVFASPEEVETHPRLTPAQKADVLRRWLYDATEMSVAQEEGMAPAVDDDLVRRVSLALRRVTGEPPVTRGPTKHGAGTSARVAETPDDSGS